MRPVFLIILLCFSSNLMASDPEAILMLADYVAVDYSEAVRDGKVINEFEYEEMNEFANEIQRLSTALPEQAEVQDIQKAAAELANAIENKNPVEQIQTLTGTIRELLLTNFEISSHPSQTPRPALGKHLFQQHCTACHGTAGDGQGELSIGMDPAPTDFTDPERAVQRSVYGLYATISRGVEGTTMPSFNQLDEHQRWSLAYYAAGLHASSVVLQTGETAFNEDPSVFSLETLNTKSLTEVSSTANTTVANAYAWLRQNPHRIFDAQRNDPLAISIINLEKSQEAYQAGDIDAAQSFAVDAYLEGFELVEAALSNIDPKQTVEIEKRMMQLRRSIRDQRPQTEVDALIAGIKLELVSTQALLNNQAISPGVAFSSALIILLREGLEAILILGAIAAFLKRTGRKNGMRYLHLGWVSALLLGIVTWLFSSYVVAISGATREVTEGVTALFAAGVLFYVGFWMHNKLSTQQWAKFIQEKLSAALDKQTLYGITLISFVAVYREVFETVLFYQALWNQANPNGQQLIISGFVTAALLLVVATWLIFRAGARIPLKHFFTVSAIIMFVLAVIFAGKGIAAMVEAGIIAGVPVGFMRIDVLGVYPELIGLGVQLAMGIIAAWLFLRQQRES